MDNAKKIMTKEEKQIIIKIGDRLRKSRNASKHTVDQVAEFLGCDSRAVHSYERGERRFPLQSIPKIAKLYNVSADYLLGLSEEMQPQAKEFQQATGLSEITVAILQSIKDKQNGSAILNILNQLFENPLFFRLIINAHNAKAIADKITNELTEKGQKYANAVSLENSFGNMKQLVVSGEDFSDYLKLKVADDAKKLFEEIMKGDNENGER